MKGLGGVLEFCSVVEQGGFTRAAETLGVSASFVSRRVVDLETRLGVRLLNRTTRQVNLTDLGAQYYERVSDIWDELETLETDLSDQQNMVKGRLKVSAGGIFGETWVADALCAFATEHPLIDVELQITERRIDLLREGFDLAIRHGMPSDPDLVVRPFSKRRIIVCASPYYLAQHGAPASPEELSQHSCLMVPGAKWDFIQGGQLASKKLNGRFSSGNGPALATAAVKGLGIARLAETYVSQYLGSGALVPLLVDYEVPVQETVIVYPSRDRLPHRMRTLIDFLVARMNGGR
ncbi:MAG: LysR family transcriptional regulator [Pseudomonadota bacterium]